MVYLDPDSDYDPDSIENSSNVWGDSSEEEDCATPSAVNVHDGGFANKDLPSTSTANASSRPTRVSDQRNHLVAIKKNALNYKQDNSHIHSLSIHLIIALYLKGVAYAVLEIYRFKTDNTSPLAKGQICPGCGCAPGCR